MRVRGQRLHFYSFQKGIKEASQRKQEAEVVCEQGPGSADFLESVTCIQMTEGHVDLFAVNS